MPNRAVIGMATLFLVMLSAATACGPMVPDLPLLDAIDQNNADAVRGHMEFGTDPNQTFIPPGFPFAGASALHLAVLKDDQEIARTLMENGANIDLRARDAF